MQFELNECKIERLDENGNIIAEARSPNVKISLEPMTAHEAQLRIMFTTNDAKKYKAVDSIEITLPRNLRRKLRKLAIAQAKLARKGHK